MVIKRVVVMPVESPVTPSPSKTAEPADSEAKSKRQVRTAKPDSRIWIPSRPRYDGISVNQPRIIRGDIYNIRISRLNFHCRVLRRYSLLRCVLQIAGLFRFLAHELYRIHHILLLVVVGVTKR